MEKKNKLADVFGALYSDKEKANNVMRGCSDYKPSRAHLFRDAHDGAVCWMICKGPR